MLSKIKPVIGNLDNREKETVLFAAKELSRCLALADSAGDFPVIPVREYRGDEESAIFLLVGHSELPVVEDLHFDDAIRIRTDGLSGHIAGTNARALLIAAYRFLRENGFAFIRPGRHGEIVPECFAPGALDLTEAASYRHRGICIEGSVYQEGFIEMIDWLPKVGMNGYFIQFPQPNHFFRRYYEQLKKYSFTGEEMAAMADVVREEILRRSLLNHAVGHCWTCEALGIDSDHYHSAPEDPTPEQVSMMAEVKGTRGFFGGNPLNTNLCYSQKRVRDRMNGIITEYCLAHPEVDYLHFWVADGGNNNCECEECRRLHTSDHYVMMLNELDEKLTAAGIRTKVVFLIYSGLIWAPLREKIRNPDRFVMMFAPFLRDYTHSLDPSLPMEIPPYDLNHQPDILKDISEHLGYYRDWRRTFDGDSFDFDYHFCQEFVFEQSGYHLAKVLHRDIVNLRELGMNGLMSCQVQRSFLPTALGMNTMAATLWNSSLSFEDIAARTLREQFGEEYGAVQQYLSELSEYSVEAELNGEGELRTPENKEKMRSAIHRIRAFREEYTEKVRQIPSENIRHSWEGLLFFGEMHEKMFRFYLAENKEAGEKILEEFAAIADSRAAEFRSEFDRLAYFVPAV